jgi:hypothetical protein
VDTFRNKFEFSRWWVASPLAQPPKLENHPNVYGILVGKPEGNRPLGRPRRRWKDGIKMDLREIGFGGVEWIQLAQDRDRWRAVVSAVMNLRALAPRS